MNRQRYRLVFNARTGSMVAVAEHTTGRGKSTASGAGLRSTVSALGVLAGSLLTTLPALAQLPVPSATFVTAGQAAFINNGLQAYVNQVGDKSILNWANFNVGAGQSIEFRRVDSANQLVPGASFTSLNRIWDAAPSVIYGSIGQGAGQNANVILVNSNGIAFMGGSQVNLNTFTASTLNMADRFVLDKLLGDNSVPQFEKTLDGQQARGFIKVFEGANISATSQGRVMLIAPTVVNRGTISAPDGQVILAAGTRAFLRVDRAGDPNVVGLLVEVDSVAGLNSFNTANTTVVDTVVDGQAVKLTNAADDKLGHATNVGTLSAARGNVTMVGYAVNQLGIASATTSVVANGSVYLKAKDTVTLPAGVGAQPISTRGGQVTLGPGSMTQVTPEMDDKTTTVDNTKSGGGLEKLSQVQVLGQRITLRSGSVIDAPSGQVSLAAVDNPSIIGGFDDTQEFSDSLVISSTARQDIEQGARISVAGKSGVQVEAARNTVEVELRGNELKDSPINRIGPLRGEKANVDIEQALARSASGKSTLIAADSLLAYRALQQRTAAERSTAGGSVKLRSQGETVVQEGAVIDLSGGSLAFQDGTVKTTVLYAGKKLVDLADADAETQYGGIASRFKINYDTWNKQEVIELPSAQRFVSGYTEGKDAGSLNIQSAGSVFFKADVQGRTVVGERQATSGTAPRGAQLTFGIDNTKSNKLNQQVVLARGPGNLPFDYQFGSALPDPFKTTLTIDAELLAKDRVAELTVFSEKAVEVRDALRTTPAGVVKIQAPEITVRANIDTPGGKINLSAKNLDSAALTDTFVRVNTGVQLTANGVFVNRLAGLGGGSNAPKQTINGGSISLAAASTSAGNNNVGEYRSRGTVSLGQGVVLDASGGGLVDANGKLSYGSGGNISVTGFAVDGLSDATLSAYGLSSGGTLSIAAQRVQIGQSATPVPSNTLQLAPEFFTQGGFSNYNLTGLESLKVAANTVVAPVVKDRTFLPAAKTSTSGTAVDQISGVTLRDAGLRAAASVNLTAERVDTGTGDLTVEQGSRVEVDPGGSITLRARNTINVQGALVARGGSVSAVLDRGDIVNGGLGVPQDQNTLWLGPQALIDVSGIVQTSTDAKGQTQGTVRNGGTVNLEATKGYIVAQKGARVDVSGAAPVRLDQANESGGIGRDRASDAGSVKLSAEEGILFDGTFAARGGSLLQRDGSLEVNLTNNRALVAPVGTLVLSNTVAPQTAGLVSGDTVPSAGKDIGSFGTNALEAAGFDRLRFSSRDGIRLVDGLKVGSGRPLALAELTLDAARIETDSSNVSLTADAVRLGNYDTNNRVGSAGTAATTGTLNANARLLELAGNVRLLGMSASALTGTEQVQLAGVTQVTQVAQQKTVQNVARIATNGDLLLRGGVVNPSSFADVQIDAGVRDVRIESVGSAPIAPLSALGSVRINAQNITQAGRLVAPLGKIELNATGNLLLSEGGLTSVSASDGQVLPLGQIQNSSNFVVNLKPDVTPEGQVQLAALPRKSVSLKGQNVLLKPGSVVDVAGGGDLQAYEFTVGPGGGKDILSPADALKPQLMNTYAILPGYQGGFAPSDAQEPLNRATGESVYLSGVSGLRDGTYTLLPAHYALLPGALAVRLNDSTPLFAGQAYTRADGVRVAAGYVTDSRAAAPRQGDWRSIQVLTREQVQDRSEFKLTKASDYFAAGASRPQDAGQLTLVSQSQIQLDGRLIGNGAPGGRGSTVDISAPELLIAGGQPIAAGNTAAVIQAQQLNSLGAESLLLGGTRSPGTDGTQLDVLANKVTLANDAATALQAPEVMVVAKDTVALGAGAAVTASSSNGLDSAVPQSYMTAGNGAALMASSKLTTFSRTGSPDRAQGTLTGDASSAVSGSKSVVLDATKGFGFAGKIAVGKNGSLQIGASSISFGAAAAPANGKNFSQTELDALAANLDTLALNSYSSIDVHGDVRVGGLDGAGNNTLKNLTLQAAALTGVNNTGLTATVRADKVVFSNEPNVTVAAGAAAAASTLNVVSKQMVLGAGSKAVRGFDQINIQADQVVAQGKGDTQFSGETRVKTASLTGASGANQSIDTGTRRLDVVNLALAQPLAASDSLGASWALKASELNFDTRADLASGALSLSATAGNVSLGGNADINVAGRNVAFFDQTRGTAGGTLTLESTNANVVLDARSQINVSGAAGADGGTLQVNAVNGSVVVATGNFTGQAPADAQGNSGAGARAGFDVKKLDNASAVIAALQAGGFDGEKTLRARTGDISLAAADKVRAKQVTISADAGSINVVGSTVSASGEQAGKVGLYAGQNVVLDDNAQISAAATASGAKGGQVEIAAANGNLDLRAGTTIDVSGNGGDAGEVKLRALRNGNDVKVTALQSTITGAKRVDLEAVRVYNNINLLNATGASTGTTLSLTDININDTAFAGTNEANHNNIKTRLGQPANLHIVSGSEVRSTGNLALGTAATDWNLASSAPGGEAGVLTLRAQGNLNINSNLSDGFSAATPLNSGLPTTLLSNTFRSGQSWSYRLVAGADASAANPLDTVKGRVADLNLAAGKLIRTGTGRIQMAAARDINLLSASSVVYTAGKLSDPLAGFTNPIASQRPFFTQNGGDVSMRAGRDINGVASTQLYSNWLFRQGQLDAMGQNYAVSQGNPAWWVRFDQFQQGVGVLGGGDVTITAGNNVKNLSASASTQGRMASTVPDITKLVKTGGGNVTVEAGADVLSGQYFADNGNVKVTAGGQIDSGYAVLLQKVYPIIALGDGKADVRAKGDVNIHTIINPTLLPQSYSGASPAGNVFNIAGFGTDRPLERISFFSTYSAKSAASLSSLVGNTVFYGRGGGAGVSTIGGNAPFPFNQFFNNFPIGTANVINGLSYLPPSLSVAAFSGDVKLPVMTLLPSSVGRFDLLAKGNVQLNGSITQSDNDPAAVASVLRPTNNPDLILSPKLGLLNAVNPVHTGDTNTAKVYAVSGDVQGKSSIIALAQAVEVRAGQDILDLNLNVQHANTDDRSVVQSGRDLILNGLGDGVIVGGQGTLAVNAGRNINLGSSVGLISRGDLDNPSLPAKGVDIQVLAGAGAKGLDAAGALQRLTSRFATPNASVTDLYLARWLTGNAALDAAGAPAALAALAGLPAQKLSDQVRNFVFTALRQTGRDANVAGGEFVKNFDRGYAALELVFPGIGQKDAQGRFLNYQGGVNMFASRIRTLRDGNIEILVPGGGLVVGLPNTPASLIDKTNVQGIVASQSGDIKVFTRDDVSVNQSRILTVGGGDILIWSSEGNIDAGKGAKTASSVPPPLINTDPVTGRVTQELQGAASGSGIGALSTNGIAAGNVDLIAPRGTVDAGDAGIRANNLNIAAAVVKGADNITVSGTSAGTPVADTSVVTAASSGASSGGNDSSKVVEALNKAAGESAKAAQEMAASMRPSVVRVDVLGYGE